MSVSNRKVHGSHAVERRNILLTVNGVLDLLDLVAKTHFDCDVECWSSNKCQLLLCEAGLGESSKLSGYSGEVKRPSESEMRRYLC